jgi:hypothetical protein
VRFLPFPPILATETVTTYRTYGRGTLAYTQCTRISGFCGTIFKDLTARVERWV